MIAQIFNTGIVSGPETLVLPNLKRLKQPYCIVWLREERLSKDRHDAVLEYLERFAKVHIIPVHQRRDLRAAQALRGKLEELQVKVAHAHNFKAAYLLNLGGVSNIYKQVVTHHGVHGALEWKIILYDQFFTRRILPSFDRIFVVCSSDKVLLERRGVPGEKIKVHLNGVDRPAVEWSERAKVQAEIRKNWGLKLSEGEKVFGIVGRLAFGKDHELGLKVFDRCRQEKFKVVCFGSGPFDAKLKRLTAQMKLEDKVLWMGYRGTIGSELAGLDGLLSFSRAEGLPINLIEAAFASTPIFSRGVDGVNDLIPSPEYGFKFSARDNAAEVSRRLKVFLQGTNESQAKAMFERVQRSFSGESWAKRYEEIISDYL
jgi:L-malate glycosyltransferase